MIVWDASGAGGEARRPLTAFPQARGLHRQGPVPPPLPPDPPAGSLNAGVLTQETADLPAQAPTKYELVINPRRSG
jgi:hypothetical protein